MASITASYEKFVDEGLMGAGKHHMGTTELLGVSVSVQSGVFPMRSGMNVRLGVLECGMLLAGTFDIGLIAVVAPNARIDLYKKQSDYGPRTSTTHMEAIYDLVLDRTSRRAVFSFNDQNHFDDRTDLACTLNGQHIIRHDVISTIYSMRSWDVVFGLPMDLMMFSVLNQVAAQITESEPGFIQVNAGSMHAYDTTKDKAKNDYSMRLLLTDIGIRDSADSVEVGESMIAAALDKNNPLNSSGVFSLERFRDSMTWNY